MKSNKTIGLQLTKHRNTEWLFFVFFLVMMWFVAGWNTYNDDYDNYITEFTVVQKDGIHTVLYVGYQFIENIFASIGFDYATYRIAVYGIFISFLGVFVYRWSSSVILTILFYIVFHFLRDCVETRNFIASIFILYTMEFYGKQNKNHKYGILMMLLVGFSVHMTFILYFVFLLVEKKKWNYWRVLLFCFVFSFIFKFLAQNSLFAYFIGQDDYLDNQVDNVLSAAPKFAVFAATLSACFNGFCLSYFRKSISNSEKARTAYVRHLPLGQYSIVINNINSLTNCFIILTTLHGGFYDRLFANIIILNFIFFINVIRVSESRKNILILLLVLYVVTYSFLLQIRPFQVHFFDVINNNSLF